MSEAKSPNPGADHRLALRLLVGFTGAWLAVFGAVALVPKEEQGPVIVVFPLSPSEARNVPAIVHAGGYFLESYWGGSVILVQGDGHDFARQLRTSGAIVLPDLRLATSLPGCGTIGVPLQ